MKAKPNVKNIILQIIAFLAGLGVFIYYYGIFLPFTLALIIAFLATKPTRYLQKALKSWSLSVTIFLGLLLTLCLSASLFLGTFVNRDFNRLKKSVGVLISQNQSELDGKAQKAKAYLQKIYPSESFQQELVKDWEKLIKTKSDSSDSAGIDLESLGATFTQLKDLFTNEAETKESSRPSFGAFYLIGSTLFYFVLILYQIPYFNYLKATYLNPFIAGRSALFWQDFKASFIRYFQLRTKIVLYLLGLYAIAFILLDLPGTLLLLTALFFLLYIPYFHYLLLLPIALGCVVLSVEHPQSFLFFFGFSLGTFIVASLVEELLLIPRIMEKNIGMNSVIMVLALSFWTYSLGNIGLLLAIPLTSLIIIYTKRYLLPLYQPENLK